MDINVDRLPSGDPQTSRSLVTSMEASTVNPKGKTIVTIIHEHPYIMDPSYSIFPCMIPTTTTFFVSRKSTCQKPLIQHQEVEIPYDEGICSKKTRKDGQSSPTGLGVISVEGSHPIKKTVQLQGAYEEVDKWINEEPLYVLADGVIARLTWHDRHFKPT
ncbi:hypothetical protein AMTR_s00004p00270170 [Amborella trichopoda]|uniref:Uncharacterized protein n=1 Tax=Amborella trichopoda TaxID=13333 RepID=W1NEF0_AMBTC|nr:hypothetical protein AMTR_s00004p00270170 [Amborella trichopoda]